MDVRVKWDTLRHVSGDRSSRMRSGRTPNA